MRLLLSCFLFTSQQASPIILLRPNDNLPCHKAELSTQQLRHAPLGIDTINGRQYLDLHHSSNNLFEALGGGECRQWGKGN